MEAVVKGKFIITNTLKRGILHSSNLTAFLKALAQKGKITLKGRRWQEKINFRAKINKIKANKQNTIRKYNETQSWVFEIIKRLTLTNT